TVAPPRCRVRRPARRPARCPYTTLFRSEPVLHRLDVMIRRRLDLLDGLAVFDRKRCDHRVELVYRSRRERGNLGKTRFGRQGLEPFDLDPYPVANESVLGEMIAQRPHSAFITAIER